MVVLVTVNRFIAVCMPLHATRLCSIRNVRCQLVGLFVLVVLFNIPRFFDARLDLVEYPVYNILYNIVAYCLFVRLIPLGLVIVLNVHLMLKLGRAQRLRSDMTDGVTAQENNITKVVIVLIVTFLICETPPGLDYLIVHIVHINSFQCYSAHISNLLANSTNSSVNFVIYCLFRKQFRKDLRSLILCEKW